MMAGKSPAVPKAPTGSFPPLLRLLDAYFKSVDPLPQKLVCLQTVCVLLQNIISRPLDVKFQSIKCRNKKFSKDVLLCPGGDLLMLELGFSTKVKDFEEYYVLQTATGLEIHLARVSHCRDLMERALQDVQHSATSKILAEKRDREAVIRQIENDATNRRYKQLLKQRTRGKSMDTSGMQLKAASLDLRCQRVQHLQAPIMTRSDMLPTPSLTHFSEDDYINFYEPAEDSFALLDALQNDKELLNAYCSTCPLVLEIGSGSGIISSFVQSSIFQSSIQICSDINQSACAATKYTSQKNVTQRSTVIDVVRTSLVDGLRLGNIDLIVFNPPYVPTMSAEINTTGGIAASWAGGIDGMDVTTQIMSQIEGLLAEFGLFYLVTVARNKPEDIMRRAKSYGLTGRSVLDRRAGRERLTILRFHKTASEQLKSPAMDLQYTSPSADQGIPVTVLRRMDGLSVTYQEDSRQVGFPD